MSFWSRFSGGKSKSEQKRLDYLSEGLALERQGDYEAALTSYQLALRDQPTNYRVLQNMAIAYSRTGRQSEAIRCYRRALEIQPKLSGAHYGLAFLLLRRGETSDAAFHLESFLMDPPAPSAEADRWIKHAKETLDRIRTTDVTPHAELETGEYPEVSD
ncbi:MAG TPA: tetratricopeptide repeat protein [Gemmatimonadaceae bacterium]|nr:tetratricopeptide repeat protein [Gemmatimonadaceae bacterium]